MASTEGLGIPQVELVSMGLRAQTGEVNENHMISTLRRGLRNPQAPLRTRGPRWRLSESLVAPTLGLPEEWDSYQPCTYIWSSISVSIPNLLARAKWHVPKQGPKGM